MNPESHQSRETDSGPGGAHPEATTPEPTNARVHPLFDATADDWALPVGTELKRTVGVRAVHAAYKAQAQRLDAQGDRSGASAAYRELAEYCWANGFDYDEAIRAARRANELVPTESTRVALAERLAHLGAHLACAEVVEADLEIALASADPARVHVLRRRLAELYYRAGDAETAVKHLGEMARTEPESTESLTAIGTLAGWAPEQVSRERGVVAWQEAARRFKTKGALLSAFEATQRAFELDPASSLAAERLAHELELLGRRDAADEVWRQSAVAAGDSARHDVRALAALDAGDIIAALAAMLDGRADCTFDRSQLFAGVEQLLSPHQGMSRGFEAVLAELGCADWLAVRLEAGPLIERWTEEAGCQVALGRLEAGYFVHLDAAREALVRAIIVQPGQPEARARLSNWGTSDAASDVLLRALVQSVRAAQGGLLARQLAGEIAERSRAESLPPGLLLWAYERLLATGHLSDDLRSQIPSLTQAAGEQYAELRRLDALGPAQSIEERVDALRFMEGRLALDPARAIEHLAIVAELVALLPTDLVLQSLYVELLDVAARLVISPSRDERLSAALAQAPRILGERGCIAQAKFHLRHGQIEQALAALLGLLDEKTPSVRGLLWLFTLARRFRDSYAAARAVERVSSAFRPAIRGILESLSADLYVEARVPEEALRLLSCVVRTNQNIARLVTLEVYLAEFTDPSASGENIERSLSKVLPSAQLCCALARAHQRNGEPDLALAWTQRAVSLRPGDTDLRNEQLHLMLEMGDVARVCDLLGDLTGQALPIAAWVETAASALAWLTSMDVERAIPLAKRLLDCAGASNRSLRAALLDAAHASQDEPFAIEVLERAAAVASNSPEVQLALAERRWRNQQFEAGMLAALRAAKTGAATDSWSCFATPPNGAASADAELLRLELTRLWMERQSNVEGTALAIRSLAVARFDLAQDPNGAVAAWCELGQDLVAGDWRHAARDMGDVLGAGPAASRLLELARSLADGADRAKILGLAAQLSFEAADHDQAIQILEQALLCGPVGVCLLPLAERIARQGGAQDGLESLFLAAEQFVLGVFGERSLHYRAARAFEFAQKWSLALRHALLAFEILPDDAAAWQVLVRCCRGANDPQVLATAAMRVAEAASERSQAHRWLTRAFEELGESPDELRLKFDLAIRLLVGTPRVRAVRQVADCLELLGRAGVEEVEFMRMRFERALDSLLVELEGPDGARLGIAVADVSLVALERFDIVAHALFAAIKADADIEEYALLAAPLGSRANAASDVFRPVLQRILDWAERPYVQVGPDAIGLLTRLSVALRDEPALVRLRELVSRTGRQSWWSQWGLEDLLDQFFDRRDGRADACFWARTSIGAGGSDRALDILERAAHLFGNQASPSAEPQTPDEAWLEFRECFSAAMAQCSVVERLEDLRARLVRLQASVPLETSSALRVELERRSSDSRALCAALAELGFVTTGSPARRAEILVEAAHLAESFDDLEGALIYYRTALSMQRASVDARLGFASLLVRSGRHRSHEQAQVLLDAATGLDASVSDEQRDLAVFLRVEALDALGLTGDAIRVLEQSEARLGPRTLIVLGLAEHALMQQQPDVALSYFAAAMGGNLYGLRHPADVSMAAARAAAAAGDVALALDWLTSCLDEPRTRPDALVLQAELRGVADVIPTSPTNSPEAAATSAAAPAQGTAPEREVPSLAVGPDAGAVQPKHEQAFARPLGEPQLAGILIQSPDETMVGADTVVGESRASATLPAGSVRVSQPAGEPPGIADGDGSHATDAITATAGGLGADNDSQRAAALIHAVEPTALELAVALAEQAAQEPNQARAWLADGKRWLQEWPLSVQLAEHVQAAARLESHFSHVAALEHLISVLRGDALLSTPGALTDQPLDVDGLRSLLSRGLATPESEALALIWDGAEHEFLREASEYGVTGVMRVVGMASPLSRTYSDVVRRLGIPKTPLFHRRSVRPLVWNVLLLSPIAALLDGEIETDEALMGYRLGCALWATIPEHSLVFGMAQDQLSVLLRALVLAFGSTGGQPNPTQGESLRLAQVLWQTVRNRSQRRLKEICSSDLDQQRARTCAILSLRRAGLYVCGNLRVALAAACHDSGFEVALGAGASVSACCEQLPALLDLVRFAASAEYADMRWHTARLAQLGGGQTP